MLQSYEAIYRNGKLEWLDTPPAIDEARVIVTVLHVAEETNPKRRQPPTKLKGIARTVGDIVSSPFSEDEWEAMHERTARQLARDSEALK